MRGLDGGAAKPAAMEACVLAIGASVGRSPRMRLDVQLVPENRGDGDVENVDDSSFASFASFAVAVSAELVGVEEVEGVEDLAELPRPKIEERKMLSAMVASKLELWSVTST
jgi:hypothetical protein